MGGLRRHRVDVAPMGRRCSCPATVGLWTPYSWGLEDEEEDSDLHFYWDYRTHAVSFLEMTSETPPHIQIIDVGRSLKDRRGAPEDPPVYLRTVHVEVNLSLSLLHRAERYSLLNQETMFEFAAAELMVFHEVGPGQPGGPEFSDVVSRSWDPVHSFYVNVPINRHRFRYLGGGFIYADFTRLWGCVRMKADICIALETRPPVICNSAGSGRLFYYLLFSDKETVASGGFVETRCTYWA